MIRQNKLKFFPEITFIRFLFYKGLFPLISVLWQFHICPGGHRGASDSIAFRVPVA